MSNKLIFVSLIIGLVILVFLAIRVKNKPTEVVNLDDQRAVSNKDENNEKKNKTVDDEIVTKDNLNNNNNQSKTSKMKKEDHAINGDYVKKYDKAKIYTNLGEITIEFYNDLSPITVNNFLSLADQGFYDDTKFHRIMKDFMIQGGDPNSKDDDWSNDGLGDPGYKFNDEFNDEPLVRGSIAMANSGPNSNGSQFFIVTLEETPWLDKVHTNFGKVIEGMDVVDKIENMKVNEAAHPIEDAVIQKIELIEKK